MTTPPVENHGCYIATKGTPHLARSNPHADACWIDKKHKDFFPADNEQPSTRLKSNATTNATLIDGYQVWIQPSVLDAADSRFPHPGKEGGTNSGTYLKFTRATTWSADTRWEGWGCVRTYDWTEQNGSGARGTKYNCQGRVYVSGVAGYVAAVDEAARKRCQFKSLRGKCKHEGNREIDAVKKEVILEILGEDVVTVTAERIAQGPPVVKSPCKMHTNWTAERTEGKARKSEDKQGDVWSLPKELLENPWSLEIIGESKAETERGTDKTKEAKNVSAGKIVTAAKDFEAFVHFMHYLKEPPVVVVHADACAGPQSFQLRIFPSEKQTFTIIDTKKPKEGGFSDFEAKVRKIQEAAEAIKSLSGFLGKPAEIEFLKCASVVADVAFKELTEDKNKRYKWQVFPRVDLKMSFSPLVKATVDVGIPIVDFAGCVGHVAAWILEKVGAEGDFYFKGSLSLSVDATIRLDEYGDVTNEGGGGKLVGTVELGIRLKIGSAIGASLAGYVTTELTMDNFKYGKTCFCEFDVGGKIQLGIKGAVSVSVWGWKGERELNWAPTQGMWEAPKATFGVWSTG